jgi:hypothetical protein
MFIAGYSLNETNEKKFVLKCKINKTWGILIYKQIKQIAMGGLEFTHMFDSIII